MRCKDCEYVKCYAVNKKMYYCDNRNRVNLMGKLGEDNLPETSPEWCPMADMPLLLSVTMATFPIYISPLLLIHPSYK